MSTIRVHLAEVPTDVLVTLADAGQDRSFTVAGVVHRLGRDDDSVTRSKVVSALRLLVDGGLVELVSVDGMAMCRATVAGREAVSAARSAADGAR